MIRQFSVINFLSIRDRQTLDFRAKGPASPFVAEMPDGTFLYKLAILFGANASGKSNILIALNQAISFMVTPRSRANLPVRYYNPFRLIDGTPTQFELSFYAADIRYDYTAKYDRSTVLFEELYYYPDGNKKLFYRRENNDGQFQAKISFGPSLGISPKTQQSIRENTLNNHSVLSVCLKATFPKDFAPMLELHKWIMSCCHEIDGDNDSPKQKTLIDILKSAYADPRKRQFFDTMLSKADLNISGFRPVTVKREIDPALREKILNSNELPEEFKKEILQDTEESVIFFHSSDSGTFEIPIDLQSRGTFKFIRILEPLYDLVTSEHVYELDELGEDLHYDLLVYYINVFLYNSQRSQLIITSQETSLLNQDLINDNRGLIWLVEKNASAASQYTRGDRLPLPASRPLHDAYTIGALGARPETGSFFLDL